MKGEYGQSSQGNFKVIDTIGVPHAYCITPKHVVHAADHFGGMLTKEAIEDAEQHGAECDTCLHTRKSLSYKQHQTALLVGCLAEFKDSEGKANPELHQYLLSIKDECEKNGYVGFALKKGF